MTDPATGDKDTVEGWFGLVRRDSDGPALRRSGPTESRAPGGALDAVTCGS
jgi:hypothetical protein